MKQYDIDDMNTMSQLNSLGLRLLALPCHAFSPVSTRFKMMISLDQAIQCLETELGRPESEKKRLDSGDRLPDLSVSATPALYNSYSCS